MEFALTNHKRLYLLKLNVLLIGLFLIVSCGSLKIVNETQELNYTKDQISGQLKTAERLKHLMDELNYKEAIKLFSSTQQDKIRSIQNDK